MVQIGNDWDALLADEFEKDYYLQLRDFLKQEYQSQHIYPPMKDIFHALKYTAYSQVKVVILGQDPYHEVGQAHGMRYGERPEYPHTGRHYTGAGAHKRGAARQGLCGYSG